MGHSAVLCASAEGTKNIALQRPREELWLLSCLLNLELNNFLHLLVDFNQAGLEHMYVFQAETITSTHTAALWEEILDFRNHNVAIMLKTMLS